MLEPESVKVVNFMCSYITIAIPFLLCDSGSGRHFKIVVP